MTRIMEAPDWVVMAWRCEYDDDDVQYGGALHI